MSTEKQPTLSLIEGGRDASLEDAFSHFLVGDFDKFMEKMTPLMPAARGVKEESQSPKLAVVTENL